MTNDSRQTAQQPPEGILGLIIAIGSETSQTFCSRGLVGFIEERYSMVMGKMDRLVYNLGQSMDHKLSPVEVYKVLAKESSFGIKRTMVVSNSFKAIEDAYVAQIPALWVRSDMMDTRSPTWRYRGRSEPLEEMPLLEAIQKITKEWGVPVRPRRPEIEACEPQPSNGRKFDKFDLS